MTSPRNVLQTGTLAGNWSRVAEVAGTVKSMAFRFPLPPVVVNLRPVLYLVGWSLRVERPSSLRKVRNPRISCKMKLQCGEHGASTRFSFP